MIFVILDDNTLDVHDNEASLNGAYETIDVENGEYTFFDEDCNVMFPKITKSAEKRIFFGLIPVIGEGNFELFLGECKREEILSRLSTISVVNQNKWFTTTAEVLKFLEDRQRGV